MKGLVADIGGTNARFAIVEDVDELHPRLSHCETLLVADNATLDLAIERYLENQKLERPKAAAFAVACPVVGDLVKLTNNDWQFSQNAIRTKMDFERFHVFNDFSAQALALPHLMDDQLRHVQNLSDGDPASNVLAVLGPGTGLGVAGLLLDDRHHQALASEGGHMSFAPLNDLEFEIARILGQRYGRISYERLLCGQGIRNLYEALTDLRDVKCESYAPSEITANAVDGSDENCTETLSLFCAILGGFAGDIALMLRARHIYIGGGIVPRFVEFFKDSDFLTRFEAKGRFKSLMHNTPVSVITEKHPGLIGAAASLNKEMK
ncbi:MAG: glucokinase [Sphingomonadales bacterium]|jgi:glucokinase